MTLAIEALSLQTCFLFLSPRRKWRLRGWDRRPSRAGNPLPSAGLPHLQYTGPHWGPHQRGCCCSHHPPLLSFCMSHCLSVSSCFHLYMSPLPLKAPCCSSLRKFLLLEGICHTTIPTQTGTTLSGRMVCIWSVNKALCKSDHFQVDEPHLCPD